jgi:hypothetical protein
MGLIFSIQQAQTSFPLFDNHTLSHWQSDHPSLWKVKDSCIVADSLHSILPHNEFLVYSERTFTNFILDLDFKITCTKGTLNAGIQFHSQRIPNHHEMIGYQADIGNPNYWGALYDESRRKKILSTPTPDLIKKTIKPEDWNHYQIHVNQGHIRLYLNHTLMSEYHELDSTIPQTGYIALQIHGKAAQKVYYKNIIIQCLP